MKVRRRFSFPDLEVCFLPNEGPSTEETHSVPPSALAGPTEIPPRLQLRPSTPVANCTKTRNRAISWACGKPGWTVTLQEGTTGEATGGTNGERKQSCNCAHQSGTAKQLDSTSGPQMRWHTLQLLSFLQTTWGCLQWWQGNLAACKIVCEEDFQTSLLKTSLEWWLCPETQCGLPTLHVSVTG